MSYVLENYYCPRKRSVYQDGGKTIIVYKGQLYLPVDNISATANHMYAHDTINAQTQWRNLSFSFFLSLSNGKIANKVFQLVHEKAEKKHY